MTFRKWLIQVTTGITLSLILFSIHAFWPRLHGYFDALTLRHTGNTNLTGFTIAGASLLGFTVFIGLFVFFMIQSEGGFKEPEPKEPKLSRRGAARIRKEMKEAHVCFSDMHRELNTRMVKWERVNLNPDIKELTKITEMLKDGALSAECRLSKLESPDTRCHIDDIMAIGKEQSLIMQCSNYPEEKSAWITMNASNWTIAKRQDVLLNRDDVIRIVQEEVSKKIDHIL